MDDETRQLKHALHELKKRHNELQSEADEMELKWRDERESLKQSYEKKISTSLERHAKESENLRLELSESKGSLKNALGLNKKLKLDLATIQEEKAKLEEEVGTLTQNLLNATTIASALSAEKVDVERIISGLRAENEELQQKIAQLNNSRENTMHERSLLEELQQSEAGNTADNIGDEAAVVPGIAGDIIEIQSHDNSGQQANETERGPSHESLNIQVPRSQVEDSATTAATQQMRRSSTISKPQPNTVNLIIGSSLLRGTKKHIPLNYAYVACRPGGTVKTLLNEIRTWHPTPLTKNVIYVIGGNDLDNLQGTMERIDEIMADFQELVTATKDKFANAKITINAIMRRRSTGMDMTFTANKRLSDLCERNQAKFSDPNPIIFSEYFASDGTHLMGQGQKALAIYLKNLLCPSLSTHPPFTTGATRSRNRNTRSAHHPRQPRSCSNRASMRHVPQTKQNRPTFNRGAWNQGQHMMNGQPSWQERVMEPFQRAAASTSQRESTQLFNPQIPPPVCTRLSAWQASSQQILPYVLEMQRNLERLVGHLIPAQALVS